MQEAVHQLWYRPGGMCGFLSKKGRLTSVNGRTSVSHPRSMIRWPICISIAAWINETFSCHVRLEPVARDTEDQFTITFYSALHLTIVSAKGLIIDLDSVRKEEARDRIQPPAASMMSYVNPTGAEVIKWIVEALTNHSYCSDLTADALIITPRNERPR